MEISVIELEGDGAMQTEIVLMRDVEGLGKEGEIIKVAPGYARNYLFTKKLAAPATQKYLKILELNKQRKAAQAKRVLANLREYAEELSKASCTIPVQAGEDGRLFGSVTAQHIAESLQQAGYKVDKKNIEMPEHIKDLGVYTVDIRLGPEVSATVKVWVVEK
jgi:large subunit ribosomal protein L9